LVWGCALPALALGGAVATGGASLLLGLLYPLQMARVYWRRRRRAGPRASFYYAVFCVASMFPQFVGLCRFLADRMRNRPACIIEYK
jgi:hypothetical protein